MSETISSRIAFIGSGVMAEGLAPLARGGFSAILTNVVDAAFQRSLELGDLQGEGDPSDGHRSE